MVEVPYQVESTCNNTLWWYYFGDFREIKWKFLGDGQGPWSKFEENLQAMCIKISMSFPLAMTFEAMSLFMAMQLESLQVNQLGFSC